MMPRVTAEWIGRTDDAMPPSSVSLRIWMRAKGRCQICERKLMGGDKWHRDHIVPLADGGANAENNLQLVCEWCHGRKTAAENRERATVRRKAKAHLGIKKRVSKPFPGSRSDKWKRKIDGTVERREGKAQ